MLTSRPPYIYVVFLVIIFMEIIIINILVILLDNKLLYACYLLVLENGDISMYKTGALFSSMGKSGIRTVMLLVL